jgi:spore coat protein F
LLSKEHTKEQHKHLAWHETMKLHELTAAQSNYLIALKMHIHCVTDPHLRGLYEEAIRCTESNLRDLLHFYSHAPMATRDKKGKTELGDMTAFYAGHLLAYLKSIICMYAGAITETATPQLRDTFVKHLNHAIKLHAQVSNFMIERGFYPAYDLHHLLENDKKNAMKALEF